MAQLWSCCLRFVVLGLLFSSLVLADHSFENTAIVRTVELGGSLVHVTTTYAVKALDNGAQVYTIALGEREHKRTSWLEAKLKGQATLLPLEDAGYDSERYVQWSKTLCESLILTRSQRRAPIQCRPSQSSKN